MIDTRTGSEHVFPLPRLARPFVNAAARVRASVHTKLLGGFLVGALLLLTMGIVSIVVIDRMDGQVDTLVRLRNDTDEARQMIYLVTAQSHYRAMAITTQDPSWNDKIDRAKGQFAAALHTFGERDTPERQTLVATLRATDDRYAASGENIQALYDTGNLEQALAQHISQEHEISHELEDDLNGFIGRSSDDFMAAASDFRSDRGLLTAVVTSFAAVSVVIAVALGLVLSWAFVRPVRQVDHVLSRIAEGDFSHRVEVPNRDEFGALSAHINHTNTQLESLYRDLHTLNAGLQEQVASQVVELERANRLRRYLAPQVADSVLAGERAVSLESSRRRLTVFFSDIRGFTAMSEVVEPEELIDRLNEYLTEMTEIVFRHGGTLDKYIGDAIMVFFGDPVPYDDHAARAVRMALEMRSRLAELQERWSLSHAVSLSVGMGISTGYVTVGNIGSPARMDYTVVGNPVNLASRLADAAAAGQILISEATLLEVEGVVSARRVEHVDLEGVARPTEVFEVLVDEA